jgi:hypothetical protein
MKQYQKSFGFLALILVFITNLSACKMHWGLLKHKQVQSEEELDIPKEDHVEYIPNWIQHQIFILKTTPPYRTGKKMVLKYRYKGTDVYYIPADCCDQLNPLYDEFGNKICSPDGGFTGKGDGRCPDFDRASQSPTIIWMEETPAK